VDNPTDFLANARLAAIVGSSDDAIIGKDLNGIITDWNSAAEELFGYMAEEVVGRHISVIAPPGREIEMAAIIERISNSERVYHFETQRRHKDGHLVDISLTVSPIHDQEGRVVGASKIARDIGEEKRGRAQRGLLAAIVNSSDDAIISKDLDGVVTSWNAAAERLFGYSADEMIGKPISIIAAPGREEDMRAILERIRRGERVEHYETQRRHRDGSIKDISLTVSPIYDGRGRIIGASKISRDISERRLAEQRLRLLMSELDHRAKNVLAVAQAILRLTRADTLPDFITAVEGRIKALARVHSQVAENRWEGAELRTLATSGLETFGDPEGRAAVEGPRVWVSPAAAQVIGILLHELATNAAKHGALSTAEGSVNLRWWLDAAGDLRLAWAERNGPLVSTPSRRSFGTQVIERNIPDQLGGTANVRWLPLGLICEFAVPAAYIVQMPPSRREQAASA
jgi:PAS domain S-box-containing protein